MLKLYSAMDQQLSFSAYQCPRGGDEETPEILNRCIRQKPSWGLVLTLLVVFVAGMFVGGQEVMPWFSGYNGSVIGASSNSLSLTKRHSMMLDGNSDNKDDDAAYEGPTLVLFVGLEGTGHHFIKSLLDHSPNMMQMKKLGVCSGYGGELGSLSYQFFHGKEGPGGMFNPPSNSEGSLNDAFDARDKFDQVVDILGNIKQKCIESQQQKKQRMNHATTINVPSSPDQANDTTTAIDSASSLPLHQFNIVINTHGPSNLSYPSYKGPDRAMQLLNLDVYYNACRDARIRCRHAYIYRDPYNVLESTTGHRHFNGDALEGIRLYTGILHQIHSQMTLHLDKNIGCFGFLDSVGAENLNDWERFGSLFGWESNDDFMAIVREINKMDSPRPISEEMKEQLVPSRLDVLMNAFVDIHNEVIDLCYYSLEQSMR